MILIGANDNTAERMKRALSAQRNSTLHVTRLHVCCRNLKVLNPEEIIRIQDAKEQAISKKIYENRSLFRDTRVCWKKKSGIRIQLHVYLDMYPRSKILGQIVFFFSKLEMLNDSLYKRKNP